MGQSPSARIGWGIDLGDEESWYEGQKYAALGVRFGSDDEDEDEDDEEPEGPGSIYDWADKILPALYVDTVARDAELDAHHARADAMIAAGQRAEYVAQRQVIVDRYAPPVDAVTYGYEFGSHALILARSYTSATDYGSETVDPATLAPPTAEEIGHLRVAVESLGLAFDPADVALILMSAYS